jgi:hypothetical protein
MDAAHECRDRSCINHVSWKTHKENNADKIRDQTSPVGEKNPRAKLTTADVVAIRAAYDSGRFTRGQLHAQYSVSWQSIDAIVRRVTWKHLP